MSTATVTGGLYVGLSLNASQTKAAQVALGALDANYTVGAVLSSTTEAPEAGAFNVYQIQATEGGTYTLPTGGQAIVLEGSADATLNGASGAVNELLIGNSGNDTVNTFGGSGKIILGSGNNVANIFGGTQDISSGPGQDTINLTGGAVNISGSGQDTVNVLGGANTINSTHDLVINVSSNDTITLGAGNDTLTAAGAATITGGTGDLVFHGGTDSTVYAGSGSETLYGGSGATTFYGSTAANGTDSMVGGSGTNFFEGGNNQDTMVSGAGSGATSDIFDFASTVPGGNHTIVGFTSGTDQIDLQGYTASDITGLTYANGNSVITLDDGTTITVKGYDIGSTDIKFTPK